MKKLLNFMCNHKMTHIFIKYVTDYNYNESVSCIIKMCTYPYGMPVYVPHTVSASPSKTVTVYTQAAL